jgi:hypothetical protein
MLSDVTATAENAFGAALPAAESSLACSIDRLLSGESTIK